MSPTTITIADLPIRASVLFTTRFGMPLKRSARNFSTTSPIWISSPGRISNATARSSRTR